MYRVILVDDEPWALSGLYELLPWGEFGFEIIGSYTDPLEAFEQILCLKPDAVITDIRMPKMSGIQMIQALRSKKCSAEVVLISAYRDFEAAREAIQYGACHYILKPFEQEEVEETIAALASKLQSRNKPLTIDPSHSESMMSQQVELLLKEASCYPLCCILLYEQFDFRATDLQRVHITPVHIVNGPNTLLVSAQTRESILCLIPGGDYAPSDGIGLSRIHTSFASFQDMLEEAGMSLQYGFMFSENPLTARIQQFLCQSVSGNISLSMVASKFHLSEAYLSGMFKKYTGVNLTTFIQNIRTYHAARMMLNTDLELKGIAGSLGYDDYNYFSRLFKRRFGMSPKAYRNSVLPE